MNPKVPDRDALSPRDRRWVEALRAQAPEGPPPSLDAVVLAAARAAVGAKAAPSTGRAGGAPRWLAAVAGVMVVLSAGVLVRQVALETAPRPEPGFPASPPLAAPGPGMAAEERADAVRRATREAEELPARERVEAAAPTSAEVSVGPAREPEAAVMAAPAGADPTLRTRVPEAAPTASPPPPEPPSRPPVAPVPAPVAVPAPPAPARPAADFAPSAVRPLAESAPAPAARSASDAEPVMAAKSAPAAAREQAEAGGAAAASVEQEAGLPEPEWLVEVRRLLAAGERELARERLRAWRERHPDAVLPSDLDALLDERP